VHLRETPGFDAERFQRIVAQVDAADGVIDGKATPPNG
jgi:hypothetical protein